MPPSERRSPLVATSRANGAIYYGLRVHLVVTGAGEAVEFSLEAGSEANLTIFKELELELAEGSMICMEKAYIDYDYYDYEEDLLVKRSACT